ncbi:MAG TPA: hypothetical protein ENK46_00015 [Flavobacteriia bacterium]|nr:hypothetical protein [Flavobacteriia bacterium]
MIHKKTLRHSFAKVFLLKYGMVFSFLLFVLVKPGITIANLFTDSKYELFDPVESDTSKEKKDIADDDCEKFYKLLVVSSTTYKKQSLSYGAIQKHCSDFNPDICLPPPKI